MRTLDLGQVVGKDATINGYNAVTIQGDGLDVLQSGSIITLRVRSSDSSGTGSTLVDSYLSATSTNPVQNKVVKAAIDQGLDQAKSYTDTKLAELTGSSAEMMETLNQLKEVMGENGDMVEAIQTIAVDKASKDEVETALATAKAYADSLVASLGATGDSSGGVTMEEVQAYVNAQIGTLNSLDDEMVQTITNLVNSMQENPDISGLIDAAVADKVSLTDFNTALATKLNKTEFTSHQTATNPHNITADMIGAVSTTALQLKANDVLRDSKAYTDSAIQDFTGIDPELLRTIQQLKESLEDSGDVTSALNSEIAKKVDKTDYNKFVSENTDAMTVLSTAVETLQQSKVDSSHIDALNPHNISKETIGLGKVENKSVSEIIASIQQRDVINALGYEPANKAGGQLATTSSAGLMSADDKAALDALLSASGISAGGDSGGGSPWFPNGELDDVTLEVGSFVNAGSGWNSFKFRESFEGIPTVILQAEESDVISEIKNITEVGFLYRLRGTTVTKTPVVNGISTTKKSMIESVTVGSQIDLIKSVTPTTRYLHGLFNNNWGKLIVTDKNIKDMNDELPQSTQQNHLTSNNYLLNNLTYSQSGDSGWQWTNPLYKHIEEMYWAANNFGYGRSRYQTNSLWYGYYPDESDTSKLGGVTWAEAYTKYYNKYGGSGYSSQTYPYQWYAHWYWKSNNNSNTTWGWFLNSLGIKYVKEIATTTGKAVSSVSTTSADVIDGVSKTTVDVVDSIGWTNTSDPIKVHYIAIEDGGER